MHRHEVEPTDAGDPHDHPPRVRSRAHAGPADGQGGVLRRVLPRRLRHDPDRARPSCRRGRRPLADALAETETGDRRITPSRGTSSISAGCAAPTRRPTRWPRRSDGMRPATGWTLEPRARGRLPGRRRSPRASSTSMGSWRPSARRSATRSGARSVAPRLPGAVVLDRVDRPPRRPRRVHRPPPAALGRRRPVPADARRRRQPALHPAPVRGVRPERAGPAVLPDGRRAPDRRRDHVRGRRHDRLLQRRGRPGGARPVARRRDGREVRRAGDRDAVAAGSTSCAATSPTSTSGARVDEPIQRLLVRRTVGDERSPSGRSVSRAGRAAGAPGRPGPGRRDRSRPARTAAPRSTSSGC